jgi:hypothetical protein
MSESSETVMVHDGNPPTERCAVQKRGGPGEKPGTAQARSPLPLMIF